MGGRAELSPLHTHIPSLHSASVTFVMFANTAMMDAFFSLVPFRESLANQSTMQLSHNGSHLWAPCVLPAVSLTLILFLFLGSRRMH